MYIKYNNGSSATYVGNTYAQFISGWQYIESEIDFSDYSNITYFRIYLLNGKYSATSAPYCEVYFDDIRFYPVDAQLTTNTYDKSGAVSSVTDMNNKSVNKTFDALGRLTYVKDADGKILKYHEYNNGN